MSKKKTSDAIEIINDMIGDDVELKEMIDEAAVNAKVAQMIYKARKESKLTQKELAEMIHTHQSVIARLEDADYEGHSLSMLLKIGKALGRTLSIDWAEAVAHDKKH